MISSIYCMHAACTIRKVRYNMSTLLSPALSGALQLALRGLEPEQAGRIRAIVEEMRAAAARALKSKSKPKDGSVRKASRSYSSRPSSRDEENEKKEANKWYFLWDAKVVLGVAAMATAFLCVRALSSRRLMLRR